MHLVILEVASVAAAVWPRVLATTFHFIVREFALVARFVKHDELALTVAVAIPVLAFEVPVVPLLTALAMLLVLLPVSIVDGLVSSH